MRSYCAGDQVHFTRNLPVSLVYTSAVQSSSSSSPSSEGTEDGYWRCEKCDLTFRTNIGAMGRHARSHVRGEPIKIYKKKHTRRDSNRGEESWGVAQQYWDKSKGGYTQGTGTKIYRIDNMDHLVKDGFLVCRKCNEKQGTSYTDNPSVFGQALQIGHWEKHEKYCKGIASTLQSGGAQSSSSTSGVQPDAGRPSAKSKAKAKPKSKKKPSQSSKKKSQ